MELSRMGEVIRKYRKKQGLTQEEMAERLGVTAPAVNKWEHGHSLPDVTLISPIARLLGAPLEELLCFQPVLAPDEVSAQLQRLRDEGRGQTAAEMTEAAKALVTRHPENAALALGAAQLIQARMMLEADDDADRASFAMSLMERALKTGDASERRSAAQSLYALHFRAGRWADAEQCLAHLPENDPERARLQAGLYAATSRREEAYRAYERLLFREYGSMTASLAGLYRLAEEDGDPAEVERLAEAQAALARLLRTGRYRELCPLADLAAKQGDADRLCDTMNALLDSLDTVDGFARSPFFRHMAFQPVKPSFLEELRRTLLASMRQDDVFAFVRDDPRWEAMLRSE